MKFSLVSIILFAGLITCFAQTTSTEVLGTVTDPSGAVVVGAKVILLRVATGEKREATTTSTGDYSFPLIDVGEYSVVVEIAGFARQERKGILVEIQQKARVNFYLTVGNTTETVEVHGLAPVLKTDESSVGQVVNGKRIQELPLNGRNVATLALLTPGVFYGFRQGNAGMGGTPFAGNTIALAANGQTEARQTVTLDGVVATESLQNTTFWVPSIDAIEEFKVQTSTFSAEFGQSSGAFVQIVFKSGTNRLHGTFYEFLRNDALDAKDYFLNFQLPAGAALAKKNRLRRDQFGAFLSGPVRIPGIYNGKDKTFWSFNFEGVRQTLETASSVFFYPQAFRNGDFSALLNPPIVNGSSLRAPVQIYDPLTGVPISGNILPPSRINKNAQNFVNTYMPLPMYQPADVLQNNYQANIPTLFDSNQYIFRIDHEFRTSDKVFVRMAIPRITAINNNINPAFPVYINSGPSNLAFQHIHLFSPRVLNEARYGLNRANWAYANPRTGTSFNPDSLGLGQWRVVSDGNRPLKASETGVPNISLVGGCCADGSGGDYDMNTFHQFGDNLSIVHGSHSLKTGFEFRRAMVDIASGNIPRGDLTCCPGGYSLAGFLLGYPSGGDSPGGQPWTQPRQNRFSVYFQDDWKASRRLTLNLGVRYDYFQIPYDIAGNWRTFRPEVLSQGSDGNMYPTLLPAPGTKNFPFNSGDNRYVMPRVGLAYRATDKWVIRLGGGWFVNPQYLNNFQIGARQPPINATYNFTQQMQAAQIVPYSYGGQNYNLQTMMIAPGSQALTLDNPFPGAGTPAARANLISLPEKNRYMNVIEWSFDIQRALPSDMTLTVAYVGNKSTHIDYSLYNFNSPDPSTNSNFYAREPYPYYINQGVSNVPQALANIRYEDFSGTGRYHGLQTSLQKRYSRGLVFGVSYTFSKALSDAYDRNTTTYNYQNPRYRKAEMQRMPFDMQHNMVVNYVYELPFLKHHKGAAGAILGGWQTNGILSLHTGFPFSLSGGNLYNNGYSRPDLIGNPTLSSPNRQLWYNPAAFGRTDCTIAGRPDLCHYGSAGPGILSTPGQHTLDLSLFKNWNLPFLGDAGKVQFRAELFNSLNSPQFGTPNGLSWVSASSSYPDAPNVGAIMSLVTPMRIIQFGMKVAF